MSSITAAEILYGLERRPEATRVAAAFELLCRTLEVIAWDGEAARSYARLRTQIERAGKSLEVEDTFIAAHALAVGAVLVTSDKALQKLAPMVEIEDWATDSNAGPSLRSG